MRSIVPVLVAAAMATACTSPSPARPGEARVLTVIDGDTIDVTIDGRKERVRLIGIDTPETKAPDTPVECFGAEAAAATTGWLAEGTVVVLTRDHEARDDYGRLLAYVTRTDGFDVNLELVLQGFAVPLSIAPNTTKADEFERAATVARQAGRGLWSACPPQ